MVRARARIKSVIRPELLGVYVNPDNIEHELRWKGYLDLGAFGVSTTAEELLAFFRSSELPKKANLQVVAESLRLEAGTLSFHQVEELSRYFRDEVMPGDRCSI